MYTWALRGLTNPLPHPTLKKKKKDLIAMKSTYKKILVELVYSYGH